MMLRMKAVIAVLVASGMVAGEQVAQGQNTIAYFNFNSLTMTPSTTLTPASAGGSGSATLTTTFPSGASNLTTFGGTTANAQNGDMAGVSLALLGGTSNANNGKTVTISFDASTFTNISAINLSFATQRTSTGFTGNTLAYSSDGINYTTLATYTPASSFGTQTFSVTDPAFLSGTNDSFRITFNGATTASGNNRIDNLVIAAVPVPEPATLLAASTLALAGFSVARRKLRTLTVA